MESRVILPAVLVLVCVDPRVGRIQTQLSKPVLVPGLGPLKSEYNMLYCILYHMLQRQDLFTCIK